jgi:hypothetical protein
MNMAIGVVKIVGIGLLLWRPPKTLPHLGKALREFQDEIERE